MERFTLNTEYSYDFSLLAIYTDLAPYRFVYMLNYYLGLRLRYFTDIIVAKKESSCSFSVFSWQDTAQDISWDVFVNKTKYIRKEHKETSLFYQEPIQRMAYFIPKQKKVDFFLKIDPCISLKKRASLLLDISKIPFIQATAHICAADIPSKTNLIIR